MAAPIPGRHDDTDVPFLRLPGELRNDVYRYLLSTKRTKHVVASSVGDSAFAMAYPKYSYAFSLSILRVNRQINREAASIFYGENAFVAITSTTRAMPMIFLPKVVSYCLIKDGEATESGNYVMSIRLTSHKHCDQEKPSTESFCSVIACDDLPRFCEALLYTKLSRLMIQISFHRDFGDMQSTKLLPKADQCRLLEPFASLHSVQILIDVGIASASYTSTIIAKAAQRRPGLEAALQEASAMKSEGNKAFHVEDIPLAIQIYDKTLRTLMTGLGHGESAITIQTGEYAGKTGAIATRLLLMQLSSALAAAHLKCSNWVEAHNWALMAVSKVQGFRSVFLEGSGWHKYGSLEHFKLLYRQAVADKQLFRNSRKLKNFIKKLEMGVKDVLMDDELAALSKYVSTGVLPLEEEIGEESHHFEVTKAEENEELRAELRAITI